jgi:type IV pilus assembly protein PilB
VLTLPFKLLSAISTRVKILSELKIDETRLAQDGRFSTRLGERSVDFRVSTFPTRDGEKVVMRILDPMTGNTELEDLGVEGRAKKLILENIDKPFGSILITGPTGSGKSTTLAAILRRMNHEGVNIVTLEDPIEYYVDGVNQSQIHEEIGYTFANGLRHILRQDPDVIMVGEIRDSETAKLATQAALTGHIVLSTLHTNDTIGVIPRLIDMEVEKYLIAPTLNLAVAQRLLRRLCDNCKIVNDATPSEKKLLTTEVEKMPDEGKKEIPQNIDLENIKLARVGNGCKECDNKLYKGRIGIFEVLEMSDELERTILANLSEENLKKEALRQGMINMYQDGIIKVLKGVTTIEELMTFAQSETQNEEELIVQ